MSKIDSLPRSTREPKLKNNAEDSSRSIDKNRLNVVIVYPFFMHYREPVFRELIENGRHKYFFAGDSIDRSGQIKAYPITPPARWWKARCFFLGSIALQPGVIWHLFRQKTDCWILLGNYSWPFTWLTAILARLMGKRVLFWTHGWIRRQESFGDKLRDRFYRLSHGLLLYGQYAKKLGVESGFSKDELYVVYNALDFESQQTTRKSITDSAIQGVKELFEQPDLPIVLCCSRITRVRRLDMLLDAAGRMKQSGHEINILLIGDGPEQSMLEAMAQKMNLNVHFYGACYDEEKIAAATIASTVTVAPGKVGLTAMQSIAYGTPVITHGDPENQMPEYESIVPGISGDFFQHNDVDDLARVICQWIEKENFDHERCIESVQRRYTPVAQRQIFDAAVEGTPASQSPLQDLR